MGLSSIVRASFSTVKRAGFRAGMVAAVVGASALGGCVPGKTGLQMFIERTNTMIAEASKKHGCIGRGAGEMESDFFSASSAEMEAEGAAYLDHVLRCVDSNISEVKVVKEYGVIKKVIADGQPMNIQLLICGRENYFDPDRGKHFSSVAVCGQNIDVRGK